MAAVAVAGAPPPIPENLRIPASSEAALVQLNARLGDVGTAQALVSAINA